MNIKRILAALLAAALPLAALAEPVDTEFLVDMTAEQVVALETRLCALGYLDSYNETYDAQTRQALEGFQQANGLEVTGMADEATLARLNGAEALSRQDYLTRFAEAYSQMQPMERGSVSNDVLVMQRRLKEYGYFTGECDGVFGDATQQAVESFQMVNGLTVTGIADGAVLMRLMADSPITWSAYLTEMSAAPGDSGLNVYMLQRKLKQLELFAGECTGSYGELTQQAVQAFQRAAGLEPTGTADAATWAALYAAGGESTRRAEARFGDFGENIGDLQKRLNGLGFFEHEITGEYGYTTETAVSLFQMACSIPATGELDSATYTQLMAGNAPSLRDATVQQAFQLTLDLADDESHATLAAVAARLLNQPFGAVDDGLYPGFAFVQYCCVAAGLPVTIPEDLIRLADQQVASLDAVEAGDIASFQSASGDNVTIQLAIGAGDGAFITTTGAEGWVVLSFMDQLDSANIYRWSPTGRFGG